MTYVSNHAHDCAHNDAIRSELWAQMAEWERKAGPVQTAPIERRTAEGNPLLVLNSGAVSVLRPPKRRVRPLLDVSQHADLRRTINKLIAANSVRHCDIAKHLSIKPAHVGNVLRGAKGATEQYLRAILEAAQYIAANPEQFGVPKRKWAEREEMVRLIAAHGLNKSAIKRACGWPGNYVYEALRADLVPNDERAAIMERVIRKMAEVVK